MVPSGAHSVTERSNSSSGYFTTVCLRRTIDRSSHFRLSRRAIVTPEDSEGQVTALY